MHKDIEHFYNQVEIENDSIEFKQFLQFYEDHKDLEIYRTEWNIFCDILRLTGSIDAVFINKDGTLSLGDWKRSKEISTESFGNKCGKYPLEYIPDCNYYHYSLQLNLYRVILEKFYGKIVKEMFLIVLHPKNKNEKYQRINIKNMDREIELMLDYRKAELFSKGYDRTHLDKVKLYHTLKDIVTIGNPMIDEEYLDDNVEIKPQKSLLRRNKHTPEKKSFLRKNTPVQESKSLIQDNSFSNKGKRWTIDENVKLMGEAIKGVNIELLSKSHGRTPSAVKMRIIQNLIENNNDDINLFTQITMDEFTTFKEKHMKNRDEKKKNVETSIKDNKEKMYKEITGDSLLGKQNDAYNLIKNGKNLCRILHLPSLANPARFACIKGFIECYRL